MRTALGQGKSKRMYMSSVNLAHFDALAAGFSPSFALLHVASAIAVGSSWVCVAVLVWAVWRRIPERPHVLAILAAGGVTSLLSQEIATSIGAPRPFMVGLSPAHIAHGARPGLPSTHASVMFAISFMLLLRRQLRDVGVIVLLVAIATAWSRIYMGVHFPFDVAAGALLGTSAAATLLAVQVLGRKYARGQAAVDTASAQPASVPRNGHSIRARPDRVHAGLRARAFASAIFCGHGSEPSMLMPTLRVALRVVTPNFIAKKKNACSSSSPPA